MTMAERNGARGPPNGNGPGGTCDAPKASAAPERQLRDRVDEKIARTLTEYA